MSNHFSADNLKFPGDDARQDFTDLFVFKSSDNPDKTVLIIDANPFINPDGAKNEYNARQPADDVANYLQPWSKLLQDNGYPPEEAKAAAMLVLPDILRYNRAQPATYPNGRVPTDDVYSARFAWLTHGKVTSDGLKPHDDLQAEEWELGLPNP